MDTRKQAEQAIKNGGITCRAHDDASESDDNDNDDISSSPIPSDEEEEE